MSEQDTDDKLLESLQPDDENVFDPKIVEEVENTETPPEFASEEWHDYVMRQFAESELDNGKPIRDGLVRVTEKLIGPIAKREVINFQASSNDNYSSTVHIRLTIKVNNPNHPLYEFSDQELIEDGIAEANRRNSPAPYHLHPSATASSKAEAQALRKALRLRKMIAADEATPEDMVMEEDVFVPDEPITREQITVIDLVAKRANVSVLDFVNSGEIKYAFIEQIPSSRAQKMISYLNQIQSGKKQSPVSKGYDPAWRDKNQKKVTNESETQS